MGDNDRLGSDGSEWRRACSAGILISWAGVCVCVCVCVEVGSGRSQMVMLRRVNSHFSGLKPLTSSDPPASASQSAGVTGLSPRARTVFWLVGWLFLYTMFYKEY